MCEIEITSLSRDKPEYELVVLKDDKKIIEHRGLADNFWDMVALLCIIQNLDLPIDKKKQIAELVEKEIKWFFSPL